MLSVLAFGEMSPIDKSLYKFYTSEIPADQGIHNIAKAISAPVEKTPAIA